MQTRVVRPWLAIPGSIGEVELSETPLPLLKQEVMSWCQKHHHPATPQDKGRIWEVLRGDPYWN